jgi:hypothetical protein
MNPEGRAHALYRERFGTDPAMVASALITGFDVHGFWPAVFGAVIISVVNWLLSTLITDRGHTGEHGYPGNSGSTRRSGPGEIDLEKKGERWE